MMAAISFSPAHQMTLAGIEILSRPHEINFVAMKSPNPLVGGERWGTASSWYDSEREF
jgi:hypothetical protein